MTTVTTRINAQYTIPSQGPTPPSPPPIVSPAIPSQPYSVDGYLQEPGPTGKAIKAPSTQELSELFTTLFDGDPGVKKVMEQLQKIEFVPVIPSYKKIESNYRSQFSNLLKDLSPQQLTELKSKLEEKASQINYRLIGSSSMVPQYLDMVKEKLSNGDYPNLTHATVRAVESILYVPVIPQSKEISSQYSDQFSQLLNRLPKTEKESLKSWLKEHVSNIDYMLIGSSPMSPKYLEMITNHLALANGGKDMSDLHQSIDEIDFVGVRPGQEQDYKNKMNRFDALTTNLSRPELTQLAEWLENKVIGLDPLISGARSLLPEFLEKVRKQLK